MISNSEKPQTKIIPGNISIRYDEIELDDIFNKILLNGFQYQIYSSFDTTIEKAGLSKEIESRHCLESLSSILGFEVSSARLQQLNYSANLSLHLKKIYNSAIAIIAEFLAPGDESFGRESILSSDPILLPDRLHESNSACNRLFFLFDITENLDTHSLVQHIENRIYKAQLYFSEANYSNTLPAMIAFVDKFENILIGTSNKTTGKKAETLTGSGRDKMESSDIRSSKPKKSDSSDHTKQNLDTKLLSIDQVCEYLKISKVTLHKYKRHGKIRFSRVGRRVLFTEEDVKEALNRNFK